VAHRPLVRLRLALALTACVAVLELVGGLVAGSLALVADSAHVFMDTVALAIALFAAYQMARPATARRTFGYARFEILAALLNGGLLFAVALLIAIEAVRRLQHPQLPEGGVMLGVALVGLAVNLAIGVALRADAQDDLNVKAALFHVASDVVGAVGVAIGGALVLTMHAAWADPAVSLVVAAIVVFGVVRVVREAADVLLESAPSHVAVGDVRDAIVDLAGVDEVHDLHVWSIGSARHVLSAHVLLPDGRISEATAILKAIEARLRERFSISHVTIQFECESCVPAGRIICTQSGVDE
jgi:cobalt-zinc-cadmium efflux system protein